MAPWRIPVSPTGAISGFWFQVLDSGNSSSLILLISEKHFGKRAIRLADRVAGKMAGRVLPRAPPTAYCQLRIAYCFRAACAAANRAIGTR